MNLTYQINLNTFVNTFYLIAFFITKHVHKNVKN